MISIEKPYGEGGEVRPPLPEKTKPALMAAWRELFIGIGLARWDVCFNQCRSLTVEMADWRYTEVMPNFGFMFLLLTERWCNTLDQQYPDLLEGVDDDE